MTLMRCARDKGCAIIELFEGGNHSSCTDTVIVIRAVKH
jgi:hypothetical protein